ncbi:MAG: BamA/TamA family outer membrane protein [Planctomycetales bacterium]|nr:BamA/TamA family outer membrane protein [Planctomycetales bacterium]
MQTIRCVVPQPPVGRACLLLALSSFLLMRTVYAQAPPFSPSDIELPTPTAQQATDEMVVDVRIEGNRGIATDRILKEIKTRSGRAFREAMVEEDVRQLLRLGWFVAVQPLYQQVNGGRVVIFRVSERQTLRYVKYLGNEKVRDKSLAKQTGLKVGDSLDPYDVEESRRKIEKFYRERGFNKVHVNVLEGNKLGDRGAVFVINEGAAQKVWDVEFIGNKIASDGRLKTQIQSKPPLLYLFKGYVDRKKIDEDVESLTAYYRSLGFFSAKIGRELDFGEDGKWLTITFVIDEGPRYKVRNVSFMGNQLVNDDRLADLMELAPGKFFNQAEMNNDTSLLRDIYGSQGYVFADIQASPRFLEEPGQLDLVYNIDEGSRYRVGRINVHIQGDSPHTRVQSVLNRVSLRTGDIIDIRELRASERRLRASGLFANNPLTGQAPKIVFSPPGSGDAQVASRGNGVRGQSPDPQDQNPVRRIAHFTPLSGEDRVLDINLHTFIPEDNQSAQAVSAPQNTPQASPPRVRMQSPDASYQAPAYGGQPMGRMTPAAQGQPLYAAQPVAAQAPVYTAALPGNAGGGVPLFTQPNSGEPYYAPTPDGQLFPYSEPTVPLGVSPEAIPFDIYVDETQTGRFMLGVGVNSDAGVVGTISLEENNFDIRRFPRSMEDFRNGTAFRGGGQRFRLEAQPGDRVQRYLVSLQEPYLFDTNVSLGLSGFFYDRRFRDWDEQRYGGRVSLGYQLTPDLSASVAYRGENVNIHDPSFPAPPELLDVIGDNVLHGFRPTLRHDTRDSAFLATQGHYLELSFEQVIGTYSYPRAEIDARQYFLIRQRPDGSGRHVLSFSGRAGFTGSDTPIYDNYFIGGFSTIRGYGFRGASPRDPATGVRLGGEFMLLSSVEYLAPITADDMLRAVAFVDFGTVEQDVEINNFRVAPGVGLRITVPALGPAPIALDFAFPINSLGTDDERIFSFSIGLQR